MGAYTKAAGSSFNGFNTAAIATRYVYSPPDGEAWMDEVVEGRGSNDGEMMNVEVGSRSGFEDGEDDEEEEVEECVRVM